MSMTLRELREWVPEIADLAGSTRDAAANHTSSADFYRSLASASTWEGDGGNAARAAMVASAADHSDTADNLTTAATGMDNAHQQAEAIATTITGILNDASASPAVLVDETTNQVIPPDVSYLDDETAAQVAAKVADLQARIADVLADGEQVDADLASAIGTATGVPAPTQPAQSLEDLLLPGAGNPEQPSARGQSDSAPADLGEALAQLAGQPSDQPITPPAPPPLDPVKVEQFKALARQEMQRAGVPADQIEARLDAMVAAAQRPLPRYVPPKPEAMPPPGFGEGFADRWFATEQGIKELIGQGGPGAPGVLESWRELAVSTHDQLTNPFGAAVDEIQHALNSPSAAYYLGEKAADGAVATPGLIFGGEGALIARAGALDGPGIPHDLIDGPTSAGALDHPSPLAAPDTTGLPLDPLPAPATTGPEFNLSNPLDHMTPDLRVLAEQHLTGSGQTVLGPYSPANGGPSYIEVAQANGATYFDIGDAWNAATPVERLAANQHVLDLAISNGDTITLSVPIDQIKVDTFTGAELRYLQAHGYVIVNSTTLVPPSAGGRP